MRVSLSWVNRFAHSFHDLRHTRTISVFKNRGERYRYIGRTDSYDPEALLLQVSTIIYLRYSQSDSLAKRSRTDAGSAVQNQGLGDVQADLGQSSQIEVLFTFDLKNSPLKPMMIGD